MSTLFNPPNYNMKPTIEFYLSLRQKQKGNKREKTLMKLCLMDHFKLEKHI